LVSAVAMANNLNMHADFEYSSGQNIEQPYGINFGLRYRW